VQPERARWRAFHIDEIRAIGEGGHGGLRIACPGSSAILADPGT